MTDEELRELAAASEAAIQMVMVLEGCTRETAVEILRQARVSVGPDKSDTIH